MVEKTTVPFVDFITGGRRKLGGGGENCRKRENGNNAAKEVGLVACSLTVFTLLHITLGLEP